MTHAPRRAQIADVMNALHDRTEDELTYPMKLRHIEEALDVTGDPYSAVLGAQELDLAEVDTDGWHTDVILTPEGRAWVKGKQLPEIHYSFLINGELTVGTLAKWAKAWESGMYGGGIHLSDVLRTWSNETGYAVHVDQLGVTEDDYIDYHISAAGEQVSVRIDGRN
ncbi:hypothetical protein ABT282_07105 [Streptomyces sp. NPDC000927]|uniref:hypothetical protein n=1 Tax=Streptomyces sp. NPDC000927 TaxID=3154371 RepID=UPI00332088AF